MVGRTSSDGIPNPTLALNSPSYPLAEKTLHTDAYKPFEFAKYN